MARRLLSIITPCFNEEGNVDELCERIRATMAPLEDRYDWEQIFIDNASRDGTVAKVKAVCARDPRVRLIVNNRNFGHIRSPIHAMYAARGEAILVMASDLQDPPELLPTFVEAWETGAKVVIGVKTESDETPLMFLVRKVYYDLISKISDVELVKNYNGFGLYDREVIDTLRRIDDRYPYFRGLIAELGFPTVKVPFHQAARKRGITSNNFYSLYDMAMLGITTHSKVPLRIATFGGFVLSGLSLLAALGYLAAKLLFWSHIPFGFAPLLIALFFFASVQLLFTGLIGEYIGFIYTQILDRPLVTERERVNFQEPTGERGTAPEPFEKR